MSEGRTFELLTTDELEEYRRAPISGPHAAEWVSAPHMVLFEVVQAAIDLADEVTCLRADLERERAQK